MCTCICTTMLHMVHMVHLHMHMYHHAEMFVKCGKIALRCSCAQLSLEHCNLRCVPAAAEANLIVALKLKIAVQFWTAFWTLPTHVWVILVHWFVTPDRLSTKIDVQIQVCIKLQGLLHMGVIGIIGATNVFWRPPNQSGKTSLQTKSVKVCTAHRLWPWKTAHQCTGPKHKAMQIGTLKVAQCCSASSYIAPPLCSVPTDVHCAQLYSCLTLSASTVERFSSASAANGASCYW